VKFQCIPCSALSVKAVSTRGITLGCVVGMNGRPDCDPDDGLLLLFCWLMTDHNTRPRTTNSASTNPILTPVFWFGAAGAGIVVGDNAGAGAGAAAAPFGWLVARDLPQDWQKVESSGSVAPQKRQNIVRFPI
jgi:hypothetical protein